MTSSTVLQKQVGQARVQLAHDRQRDATSSQCELSVERASSSLSPTVEQVATHLSGGVGDAQLGLALLVDGGRSKRQLAGQIGARCGLDLDEKVVLAGGDDLGEGEIGATFDLGPGAHRRAEAAAAGLGTTNPDEKHATPPRQILHIGMLQSLENTRSCVSSAASSQALAPKNASFSVETGSGSTASCLPVRMVVNSRSRGGSKNRLSECGPTL